MSLFRKEFKNVKGRTAYRNDDKINAKKDFTVSELANEFSVSKRTILRDLQEFKALSKMV